MKFPQRLADKLERREQDNALRKLTTGRASVDFSSNDYLGLAHSDTLITLTDTLLKNSGTVHSGSTGSRLISGNHQWYTDLEALLSDYYAADDALIFNSGYDANIGFFSSVPQRGDVVLYDELIHASIRDGLQMGVSRHYRFNHNDLEGLEVLLNKFSGGEAVVYVVTESVFSMDGDSPDLGMMSRLCERYEACLVVDEAHAIGILGDGGRGLTYDPDIRDKVFARILTFGKAPGVHGAAILGSVRLKQYLVNFARSLIYTTALPPHALAAIMASHRLMADDTLRDQLEERRCFLKKKLESEGGALNYHLGDAAIATVVIPGNGKVRAVAASLREEGFDVKAILSPTVPEGQERLRICLHTYNSLEEIESLIGSLLIFVKS